MNGIFALATAPPLMAGTTYAVKLRVQPVTRTQFEVTGGERIWYCIDDTNRRVIIVMASTKHPKVTQ